MVKKKKKEKKRPDCPHCGTPNPVSYGPRWLCRGCNRQWVKFPVPKITNNPPCPYCGGATHSNGPCYRCKVCGRSTVKIPASPKVSVPVIELYKAKVIKI